MGDHTIERVDHAPKVYSNLIIIYFCVQQYS